MSRWARWVALLDTREPATSLAACRILAAATTLATLVHAWWCGAASLLWVDVVHGGINRNPSGLITYLGATPAMVTALLIVGATSSLLMLLGALTRPMTIITWLVFRALAMANPWSGGSGDDVLSNVLFLLCWSGCGRAWSLDARWFARPIEVMAWPRYLLVLQLATIYTAAGWHKMSISWVPFGRLDAVWLTLHNPMWQRFSMGWLAGVAWLTKLFTLGSWLFEISAPLLLLAFFYRATPERPGRLRAAFNRWDFRKRYLLVGIGMHLGIELFMEVGAFFGAMMSLYACCVHPSEWRRR
jgi:hypothetical protein